MDTFGHMDDSNNAWLNSENPSHPNSTHGEKATHRNNHNNHNLPQDYQNYATAGVLVQRGSFYSRITVRTLSAECLPFVEEWRNMPDLQPYFIYKIPVNLKTLGRWFKMMDKTKNHYYVIELHGNELHGNELHGNTGGNTDGNTDANTDSKGEGAAPVPVGIVSVSKIGVVGDAGGAYGAGGAGGAGENAGKSGIVGLYIAYEQFRGRGIAKAAMDYIHHLYLREKGFEQLEACIHDHNKRSQKFFEKMGYESVEPKATHHLHTTLQQHSLALVVLRKKRWQEIANP